jgi:iron complex outermembrane recepter protein
MVDVTPRFERGRVSSYLTWKYMGDRPANVPRAWDLPSFHQFDAGLDLSIVSDGRLGVQGEPVRQPRHHELDPPGLLTNRANCTAEQAAADPNATFGVIPIQPRSTYISLSRPF